MGDNIGKMDSSWIPQILRQETQERPQMVGLLLALIPIVHLLIVWWLFREI